MNLFFRNLAGAWLATAIILIPLVALAAPISNEIKVDHFGYRPADTKISIFSANPGSTVEIRDSSDALVFRVPQDGGSIQSKGNDGAPSGDDVWWVDFSAVTLSCKTQRAQEPSATTISDPEPG